MAVWFSNGTAIEPPATFIAKRLGLNRTAWDVYLLYAPGVKWIGDQPPMPTFWMHQLYPDTGADQRFCLNPTVLLGKVADLLR